MSHATFQISSRVDTSPEELFAWHGRPGALQRLVPPFDPVRVLSSEPAPDGNPIGDGARVLLRVGKGPFSVTWEALHSGYDPPHRFVDSQVRGPFSAWRHEHVVQPEDESAARIVDTVNYRLPLHALSGPIAGGFVRRKLEATFRYRHATTIEDLRDHADARGRLGHELPLRFLVCGASGLVGRGLVALLTTGGHEVVRLVRREPRGDDEIRWDPAKGELDPAAVAAFDGVVNLSGASIAEGRWTDERKSVLAASRIDSTSTLVRALVDSGAPPRVYVQASATGFYDDGGFERGETAPLDESAPRGPGFLPELCERWEAEAAPLESAGVRTAFARFGVILSPAGGALAKLVPPFLMGAGGPVGTGRQGLCWVAYDDALAALLFLLTSEAASGPFNVVAPEPIVQRAFARELGSVLHRPAFLPLPGVAISALFGELGRTLLLRGPLVVPRRLEEAGFRWRLPTLDGALRHLLGR